MKSVGSDDIRKAFAELAGLAHMDSAMISKCVAAANNLHISPKAMADCWLSFSMNKNLNELDDHSWPSFRLEIQKEADRNPIATMSMDNTTSPVEGAVTKLKGMGKRQVGSPDNAASLPLVTPPAKRANTTPGKGTPSAVDAVLSQVSSAAATPVKSSNNASSYTPPKYEERTGAGKIVVRLQLNESIVQSTVATTKTSNAKCGIAYTQFETNVTEPYRHLFSTMDDRANALDKHLVRWEDIMREQYKIKGQDDMVDTNPTDNDLDIAPLEEVGTPRQDKICCIGRICNAVRMVQYRCISRGLATSNW
jgi:DNA polymerase alpha subunit B N-terminal